MALWVVRAGAHGETEEYALERNVVTIGWDELGDLKEVQTREALQKRMDETYADSKITTTRMWTGEVWAVREAISINDFVAIPLKTRAAIAVGRVVGEYKFDPAGPQEGKHQRQVQWIRKDLPRKDVDQDILYSMGSSLAVFQVERNNAQQRILKLLEGGRAARDTQPSASQEERPLPTDLEQFASDQIVELIGRKFRGRDLARLVAALLQAQGYKLIVSPPGADGGIDILSGSGPMGFDRPRLAVQVKSSDYPADVGVVRELQGVMPRFGADQGLVVSWGGFKDSVLREARQLYFQIRLWDAGNLVSEIQSNYDNLPADIQAELPLKKIWALVLE